jgi:hypothetical protein
MGRGGLETNLMYGNNLRSLERDAQDMSPPTTVDDYQSLIKPLVEKLDQNVLNRLEKCLDDFFFEAQEDLGLPNLIAIDRNSTDYQYYLRKFTSYGLDTLAAEQQSKLNINNNDRQALEDAKENYFIGWSENNLNAFNFKNEVRINTDLYKAPSIGDQITVDIKEHLEWAKRTIGYNHFNKHPYSTLAKMLEDGQETFSFKLKRFAYHSDALKADFSEGEQMTDNPYLLAKRDGVPQSVLDDAFILKGDDPQFGSLEVAVWATSLEKIDSRLHTLETTPKKPFHKKYILEDDNNQIIVESLTSEENRVHFVPDQCLSTADKLINEIQEAPRRHYAKLHMKSRAWKRRKQSIAIKEIASQYQDQAEIYFQDSDVICSFDNCKNKVAQEIIEKN